jgi:O-antigen/teichoic acid export membrane protein
MLLRHSAIYLVARFVPSVLGLLGIAIYTRLLSPADYGLYALVVSGAGLAQVWLFEWLRLSVLRFLPRREEGRAELVSSLAAGFLIAAGCAGGLAFAALALFGRVVPHGVLELGTLLLLAQGLFGVTAAMTWADLAPQRFALMALSTAILMLALGVLALWLGLGPLGLVGAQIIALVVAVLRPLARERRHLRLPAIRRAVISRCWRYGLPLSIASGFGLAVMNSDRFMIASLLGTGATGGFAAAYELARNPVGALLSAISQAAVPLAINRLERGGADAARAQLQRNLTFLLAIGLPATAGIALVAGDLVAVVLGVEFRDTAAALIPWIALAALLHGITAYHFDLAFQLAQNTVPMACISMMAALLNLGLNYWWIQALGVVGAAYASVVSYIFALACSVVWGRRVFALPRPDSDVLKIAGATVVMAAAVWAVPAPVSAWALGVRVLTGAVVYGATIWALDVGGLRGTLWSRAGSVWSRGLRAVAEPTGPVREAGGTPLEERRPRS